MLQQKIVYVGIIPLVLWLTGCSLNLYNQLQIINAAPQALDVYLNDQALPEVYASNFGDADTDLLLEARLKEGARATFSYWEFYNSGDSICQWEETAKVTIHPDNGHRKAIPKVNWECNALARWVGPSSLAFSSNRGDDGYYSTLYFWDAENPETLIRPFSSATLLAALPQSSLAVLSDNQSILKLYDGGEFKQVSLESDAIVNSKSAFLASGDFLVYNDLGMRIISRDDLSTLCSCTTYYGLLTRDDSAFWIGDGQGTKCLFSWNKTKGKTCLSTRADADGFVFSVSPLNEYVAVSYLDQDSGKTRILVVSDSGETFLDELGAYAPASIEWDAEGDTLWAQSLLTNSSWDFPGAVLTEHPLYAWARTKDPRRDISQIQLETLDEPSSPNGLYTMEWVAAEGIPVQDLVVSGPNGASWTPTLAKVEEDK